MRKGFKKSICTLLALSLTLGCVNSTSNIVDAKSKVKLSSTKVSMTVKQKKSISLKGVKGKKVKWSTSSKKIVTIKTSGKNKKKCTLTAKKSGNATVSAKYRGKTYKCKVTVKAKNTTTTNGVPTNKPSVPSNDGVTNTPITNPGTNPTGTPVVTESPTDSPSANPTDKPVITDSPTDSPSNTPDVTVKPTEKPVVSTETPDITIKPTENPVTPTEAPSTPSVTPTLSPTNTPEPVHEHTVVVGGTKDCHSKCSECDEVIEDGTKHSFKRQLVREAVHGVQDGIWRYTCSCGYSYDEAIPQHTFGTDHVCTVDGCEEMDTTTDLFIGAYDLSEDKNNGIMGFLYKSSNSEFTDGDVNELCIKTIKSGSVLAKPGVAYTDFCSCEDINKYNLNKVTFVNSVKAGTSCKGMFACIGDSVYNKYRKTSRIVNLDKLNTYNTTDFTSMFEYAILGGSQKITLNTASAETMVKMFYGCNLMSELILDFKGSTSHVKDTRYMFSGLSRCYSLKNTGVTFDTSKVEHMSYMFDGFGSCLVNSDGDILGTITNDTYTFIENLNTGSCKNMYHMFCNAFTYENNFELDLTGWDTSNVTNFSGMFLDMNKYNRTGFVLRIEFNTSNAKDISYFLCGAGANSFRNSNGKVYLGASFGTVGTKFETLNYKYFFGHDYDLDYRIYLYSKNNDTIDLLYTVAEKEKVLDYVRFVNSWVE